LAVVNVAAEATTHKDRARNRW